MSRRPSKARVNRHRHRKRVEAQIPAIVQIWKQYPHFLSAVAFRMIPTRAIEAIEEEVRSRLDEWEILTGERLDRLDWRRWLGLQAARADRARRPVAGRAFGKGPGQDMRKDLRRQVSREWPLALAGNMWDSQVAQYFLTKGWGRALESVEESEEEWPKPISASDRAQWAAGCDAWTLFDLAMEQMIKNFDEWNARRSEQELHRLDEILH